MNIHTLIITTSSAFTPTFISSSHCTIVSTVSSFYIISTISTPIIYINSSVTAFILSTYSTFDILFHQVYFFHQHIDVLWLMHRSFLLFNYILGDISCKASIIFCRAGIRISYLTSICTYLWFVGGIRPTSAFDLYFNTVHSPRIYRPDYIVNNSPYLVLVEYWPTVSRFSV